MPALPWRDSTRLSRLGSKPTRIDDPNQEPRFGNDQCLAWTYGKRPRGGVSR